MKPTIALLGASGAIGESIATALRAESTPYRVIGRSRPSLEKAFGHDPLAEVRTWNPDDHASVVAATEGIETLIYLIGVPYDQFHLHPQVMRQTLDGAIAAGVKRLVLIGTLYPFGRTQSPRIDETHPREPHTYKGKMRKEQEDLLMAADASGKIQGTILRLPDFYGPGVERSFLHGIFKAIGTGKRAEMIGPIDVPHEFAFVPDIGPVALRVARAAAAYGQTWNLAGAGTITQRAFAEQAFARAGQKPRLLVVNKTMLRLLGLFKSDLRELVEMNYLVTHPLIMDDTALTRLIGPYQKTPYADGIKACLDAATPKPDLLASTPLAA